MTVADARSALWQSVTKFGESMCRMDHAGSQESIHDIDDKIAVLVEAAKEEQATAMLTTVLEKAGHA